MFADECWLFMVALKSNNFSVIREGLLGLACIRHKTKEGFFFYVFKITGHLESNST